MPREQADSCLIIARAILLSGQYQPTSKTLERKEKKKYAGSKTFPASIKEKETHWAKSLIFFSASTLSHIRHSVTIL
jgi:hypothetical protein